MKTIKIKSGARKFLVECGSIERESENIIRKLILSMKMCDIDGETIFDVLENAGMNVEEMEEEEDFIELD